MKKRFLKHGRTVLVEFGWERYEFQLHLLHLKSDMLGYYKEIEKNITGEWRLLCTNIGTIKSFQYNIDGNGV